MGRGAPWRSILNLSAYYVYPLGYLNFITVPWRPSYESGTVHRTIVTRRLFLSFGVGRRINPPISRERGENAREMQISRPMRIDSTASGRDFTQFPRLCHIRAAGLVSFNCGSLARRDLTSAREIVRKRLAGLFAARTSFSHDPAARAASLSV